MLIMRSRVETSLAVISIIMFEIPFLLSAICLYPVMLLLATMYSVIVYGFKLRRLKHTVIKLHLFYKDLWKMTFSLD